MSGAPSGLVPLATALPRICPSYRAFETAHLGALANGAVSTWITSDRASVDSLFGVGPIEYGARRLDAAAKRFSVGLEVLLEASVQFRCGAWIAYGRPCYAQSGALGEVQRIPADLWMLGLSIDQARSMLVFPPRVTFSSVQCAPLLLCGEYNLVEQSLVGMSLQSAIDRYVFGDFESHVLYSTHRNGTAPENFADAFTQAIARGVLLPLSNKPAIAAELLSIIAPLVTANAEALVNVLARRFDALAYYLETLHVTWGNDPDVPADKIGDDFDRTTTKLDLCNCALINDDPGKSVTNLRFALPPEPESVEKQARGIGVTKGARWLERLAALFNLPDEELRDLGTKSKVYAAVAASYIQQKGIEAVRNAGEIEAATRARIESLAADAIRRDGAARALVDKIIERARALPSKASS